MVVLPLVIVGWFAHDVWTERETAFRGESETRLLADMHEYLLAIEPGRRLSQSLQAVERDLGFPARLSRSRVGLPGDGPVPYTADGIMRDLVRSLRSRIPAPPLAIWTFGPDLAEIRVQANRRWFPDGPHPRRAVEQLLVAFSGALDRQPHRDPQGWTARQQRWLRVIHRNTPTAAARRIWERLFGAFTPTPTPELPTALFSPRFGGGTLWCCFRLLTAGDRPDAAILGGYVVFFRESDLPRRYLLTVGARRLRGYTRKFRESRPRLAEFGDDLVFVTPPPTRMLTDRELRLPPPPATLAAPSAAPDFRRGSADPVVLSDTAGVLDRRQLEQDRLTEEPPGQWRPPFNLFVRRAIPIELRWARKLHRWRWSLAAAWLLAGCWFWRRQAVTGGLLPMPIAAKLRLLFGVTVGPGLAILLLLAWATLEHRAAEGRRQTLAAIQERLDLTESELRGHLNAWRHRLWRAKTRLAAIHQTNPGRLPRALAWFRRLAHARTVQLIDIGGREWLDRQRHREGPTEADARERLEEGLRILAVKLLEAYGIDLSRQPTGTIWTRARHAHGSMLEAPVIKPLLARETSEVDPSFTGSTDQAMLFFLDRVSRRPGGQSTAASATRPISGLLFQISDPLGAGGEFFGGPGFRWAIGEDSPGGWWRGAAFGLDATGRILPGRCWPPNAGHDRELLMLAHSALDRPHAPPTWIENGAAAGTRPCHRLPFVIVAHFTPADATPWTGIRPLLLVALLAGYGMLVLGAVSVLFRSGFQQPLQVLSAGARAVAGGNFSPPIPPIAWGEFVQLGEEFERMTMGLREGRLLTRFISREAVAAIRRDSHRPLLPGGERRHIAVLFSHFGATESAESLNDAETAIGRLNAFIAATEPVIDRHRGQIDKLFGDGLMATFHADDGTDPARDAALAAITIRRDLLRRNRAPADVLSPSRVRIGFAAGPAILGQIGSRHHRLDFTAIGDTVNVAARLEAFHTGVGEHEVVSDAVTWSRTGLDHPIRHLGPVRLKGRDQPVSVVAIPVSEVP